MAATLRDRFQNRFLRIWRRPRHSWTTNCFRPRHTQWNEAIAVIAKRNRVSIVRKPRSISWRIAMQEVTMTSRRCILPAVLSCLRVACGVLGAEAKTQPNCPAHPIYRERVPHLGGRDSIAVRTACGGRAAAFHEGGLRRSAPHR